MPKSFSFWNPEEHQEIIALLETGGPLAVLTVSLCENRFVPVIEDGDFTVPCGVVLPEDVGALASGAELALTLRTVRKPAGTAVLLALAAQLAGKELPWRAEFVLFNGEDCYSTPGESAYPASHLSSPEEYVCAVNVDGVGLADFDTSYSLYGCPEKLGLAVRRAAERLGGFREIEPWPQGITPSSPAPASRLSQSPPAASSVRKRRTRRRIVRS